MAKRQASTQSKRDKGSKALKIKEELPDHVKEGCLPNAKIFDALLDVVLVDHGSVEQYLKKKLSDQEKLILYMKWIDEHLPPDPLATYATSDSIKKAGVILLRPWHLPFAPECGLKGVAESESVRQLGQLMCLNGFSTDPTHAGVDRITVTRPRRDIGMVSPFLIPADQISEDYAGHDILAAHGLVYCKGWLRCVTATLLMLLAYDYPHFFQAWKEDTWKTFATVHCNVVVGDDTSLVETNRSATLAAQVRRRPNCFNLWHQLKLLDRIGTLESTQKAWANAAELAEAYQLGKWESAAAFRLLNDVPEKTCEDLLQLVKRFSMQKFLTHEAVAEGVFNRDYCSAGPTLVAWQSHLINSEDILLLLVERLELDFVQTPVKFRKPWRYDQCEGLQKVAAAFVACFHAFRESYPEAFVKEETKGLQRGFNSRLADSDLMSLLKDSVPPVDLQRVALFRSVCKKYDKKVEESTVAAQEQLAQQMQANSIAQAEVKVIDDLHKMKEWLDRAQDHANRQGGLDLQYLSTRFQRGKEWGEQFVQSHHMFAVTTIGIQDGHVELLKYQNQSKADGDTADMCTLIILDASLWPSRSQAIDEACEAAKSMLNANLNAAVFCLYPLPHTSLDYTTCTGYRRQLEDRVMQQLDVHEVALQFKESGHGNDKRRLIQVGAMMVAKIHDKTSLWLKAKVLRSGALGPVSRARVSDLLSLDMDRPAGPSQRVQQRGVDGTKEILEGLLEGLDAALTKKVYVVDLLPNRFAEWSRAAWQLQLKYLRTPSGSDWRYFGIMKSDDAEFNALPEIQNALNGCIIKDYWDSSPEAGAAKRTSAPFAEAMPEMQILARDGRTVKLPDPVRELLGAKGEGFVEQIAEMNARENIGAQLDNSRPVRGGSSSGGTPHKSEARTLCRPVFTQDDQPINPQKTVQFQSVMTQAEFEQEKTIMAMSKTTTDHVNVALVKGTPCEVWLTNFDSAVTAEIGPLELFGFNIGSFQEKPSGTQQSLRDYMIPFKIASDTAPFILLDGAKSISCLANLACDCTRKMGLTELTMEGHDLTVKQKEDGTPAPIRYNVKARAMVTCFEPKPLNMGGDALVRASMLGAALLPAPLAAGAVPSPDTVQDVGLSKFPNSNNCRVLWEVKVDHTTVQSVKPKFWLCCKTRIDANSAIRLE